MSAAVVAFDRRTSRLVAQIERLLEINQVSTLGATTCPVADTCAGLDTGLHPVSAVFHHPGDVDVACVLLRAGPHDPRDTRTDHSWKTFTLGDAPA